MSEENKFDFDSSEEREPQSHQSETPPDDSNSIFADIMGALGVRDSPHRQRKCGNEKKKAPPNQDSNTLSQLEMDVRNSEWAASEEITFSPEEPTKRAEIIAIEGSRRKINHYCFCFLCCYCLLWVPSSSFKIVNPLLRPPMLLLHIAALILRRRN